MHSLQLSNHYINGEWIEGSGEIFNSFDPASGNPIWQGHAGTEKEVDDALQSSRDALELWSDLSLKKRTEYLETFRQNLIYKKELEEAISQETGKPRWEAKAEIASMASKISISIEAYRERCPEVERKQTLGSSITRHKPHGVVAVFGPFNFPGHLPNGHIVPALLAGNTVVFKPSELAPYVAQLTIECWEQTNLPPGVLNMIQGGISTGQYLAQHCQLDGLFFTGSAKTGKSLSNYFSNHPEKILALEMGGNNPLVVGSIQDVQTAAYLTIQSAFLTAGQRCTCARRLIIPNNDSGDHFLNALKKKMNELIIGPYTSVPEPFMGPVISEKNAYQLLQTQEELKNKGAKTIIEMRHLKPKTGFLSPGLIDVTPLDDRKDEEYFGPLLQVIRVNSYNEAILEANRTAFGLSAGLLSNEESEYRMFFKRIRAGIINWNQPLTGASSHAPFGGVGCSGNHRPSAYYAADYCSYPVASLETPQLKMPEKLPPGFVYESSS